MSIDFEVLEGEVTPRVTLAGEVIEKLGFCSRMLHLLTTAIGTNAKCEHAARTSGVEGEADLMRVWY